MFLSWLGLMQIGCISVHPFLFNEKFFFQKPLILLDLFNITKKKLKKSLKKLFTFKKVVYICKVNKAQNNKNKNYERLFKICFSRLFIRLNYRNY